MFVRAISRVAVPGAALLLVLCKLFGVPGWKQIGYVYLAPCDGSVVPREGGACSKAYIEDE